MNQFSVDREYLRRLGCSEEEISNAIENIRKYAGFMDCRICPECFSHLFRTVCIEEGIGFCTYTCSSCKCTVGSRAEGEGQA